MFSSIRYSAANENQVRVGVSAEEKRSDPINSSNPILNQTYGEIRMSREVCIDKDVAYHQTVTSPSTIRLIASTTRRLWSRATRRACRRVRCRDSRAPAH